MKKLIFLFLASFFCTGLFAQIKADSLFKSYKIVLNDKSSEIHATVTLPLNAKKVPVVLIIPGSGDTDRDGNSLPSGIRNSAYKMLAESLAAKGIATLRYDKRGVGMSEKENTTNNAEVIEDYVNDAIAWANYLRQEPMFSKIIVLGHGEGSLIAMLTAQKKVKIQSLISLEGAGQRGDYLIRQQLSNLPKEYIQESDRILKSLIAGKTVDSVSEKLLPVYYPGNQPYLISWMKYDPSLEIKKLKIPLLLIQGTTDLQTPLENVKILSKAKPDAKKVIIENMNYALKESSSDPYENYLALKRPDLPLHKDLVTAIVDFVNATPAPVPNK